MQEHAKKLSGLTSWWRFLDEVGVSETTGWRWRRDGLITVLNVNGRYYVSEEEVTRFRSRAAAGEFAKSTRRPGARKG